MKDLRWTVHQRAISLCAAALSVALSGCGVGPAGAGYLQNTCPQASELAYEQPEESGGLDQETGGASDLAKLYPVLQDPDYPNGCEIASLATVLRCHGFNATLAELSEDYLPRKDLSLSERGVLTGPDPEKYYVGDPGSEEGWYCFEQPLADAANAYLSDHGSLLHTRIVTGAGMEKLRSCLENGVPVIVWFTVDYGAPVYSSDTHWTLDTGKEYIPYHNLHCLVLTAMEGDTCRLADPLAGVTEVDAAAFEEIYTQMGRRALAIFPM